VHPRVVAAAVAVVVVVVVATVVILADPHLFGKTVEAPTSFVLALVVTGTGTGTGTGRETTIVCAWGTRGAVGMAIFGRSGDFAMRIRVRTKRERYRRIRTSMERYSSRPSIPKKWR
jgi:hypothetical protein